MDQYKDLISVLLMLVIGFIVLREVVCWYWKINLAVKTMNEHTKQLQTITAILDRLDQNDAQKIQLLTKISDRESTFDLTAR